MGKCMSVEHQMRIKDESDSTVSSAAIVDPLVHEMNVDEVVLKVHNWLHTVGVEISHPDDFVERYCNYLVDLGLPLDRFFSCASVLHPLVGGRTWKWVKDGNVVKENIFPRSKMAKFMESNKGKKPEATKSPFLQLLLGAPQVHIRDTDEIIPDDCDWFLPEGYTELYALATPNEGPAMKLIGSFSWSTKSHFKAAHLEVFQKTMLSLSTVMRLMVSQQNSRALLQTYLGEDAGDRVFNGEIERGEGLVIRSVIWFSDIRGFTELSNKLKREEILDLINGVSDVTASIIKKYKGQTLKFMGDGIMAIFSSGIQQFQRGSFSDSQRDLIDGQASEVCGNARLAAWELETALKELRESRENEGKVGASVGIGLHYGDVSYGNVGAKERLDFTVLGPHVNLASRTEGLCSKLVAQVLCTGDFRKVDVDGRDMWTDRGTHVVKGVADPVPIFELTQGDELRG